MRVHKVQGRYAWLAQGSLEPSELEASIANAWESRMFGQWLRLVWKFYRQKR